MRIVSFLPILALFAIVLAPLHAQTVYTCHAGGATVFQDRPCGPDQEVRQLVVARPDPPAPGIAEMVADFEQRAAARRGAPSRRSARDSRAGPRAATPVSHRCTAANGAVFYRHAKCPAQLVSPGGATTAPARGSRNARRGGGAAVSDEAVPRALACREMARAGAIARDGHEHDDATDTYERNLGRDPCR